MTNSLDYLTATGFLTRQGLRVPEDVSVIARSDDVFLRALVPIPTRYHANPHAHARKAFRLLMHVVQGGPAAAEAHVPIMPSFIPGESLGRPPIKLSENHTTVRRYKTR